MALSTALPILEADIVALLLELSTSEDPAAARQAYAHQLAAAIHKYTTAALVTTAGSPSNHTGTLS